MAAHEGEHEVPAGTDLRDPGEFTAFYREALPRVYGYFLARTASEPAAQDLTQETFAAAVRAIRRGDEIASPLPWIVGIARHKYVDHVRRGERDRLLRRRAAAVVPSGGAATGMLGAGLDERAVAALRALPHDQRAALALRYLEDLAVADVAAALGRSTKAAESLLVRAREAFRRQYPESADV